MFSRIEQRKLSPSICSERYVLFAPKLKYILGYNYIMLPRNYPTRGLMGQLKINFHHYHHHYHHHIKGNGDIASCSKNEVKLKVLHLLCNLRVTALWKSQRIVTLIFIDGLISLSKYSDSFYVSQRLGSVGVFCLLFIIETSGDRMETKRTESCSWFKS